MVSCQYTNFRNGSSYSLIEPLQQASFKVTDIDGLTGLAEYRNGGLFVDTGVLILRDQSEAVRYHDVGSPLVVEWRALTVALLDRLGDAIREKLNTERSSNCRLRKFLKAGLGRPVAQSRVSAVSMARRQSWW